MLNNINIAEMNLLMDENPIARKVISRLLENHQTTVSMISHEIRNPLTLVSSSLQIIEAQHPEVTSYYGWKQTMTDVTFICNLLNQLSSFNNSNMLNPSVFSIEKFLKNICISFAISLDASQSDIVFSSSIESKMGEFTGDKTKLGEVILNVLQNAKDAVAPGGSITFQAKREGNYIVIKCTDNGCGISKDMEETLFDPFVSHKQNGTGLGLPVSKKIVEAHGGTITFSSNPKSQTTFTILLPI